MTKRVRISTAAFVLLAACALAACAARTSLPNAPGSGAASRSIGGSFMAHAVIPFGINTGADSGLNLNLSVAGSSPHRFLFDTGSAGFWVFFNAMGKHYTATPYRMTNTYDSGLVYTGTVVYANVGFNQKGVPTAKQVPVVRVDTAACDSAKPTCPASPSPKNCPRVSPTAPNAGILCVEANRQLYGTFGADLQPALVPVSKPKLELFNLLFAIAPWSYAFVVTPTQLEIGPRSTTGFTFLPLTKFSALPRPLPNGAQGWYRDVTACYTVGTVLKDRCYDTVFDTGARFVDFQVNHLPLPVVDTTKCNELVTKGTPFSIQAKRGTSLAEFPAGYTANIDAVLTTQLNPLYGKNQVNTGLTMYNLNDILFDAQTGRVGLLPLKTPGSTGVKSCNSAR